jgi:hypothetical protein
LLTHTIPIFCKTVIPFYCANACFVPFAVVNISNAWQAALVFAFMPFSPSHV